MKTSLTFASLLAFAAAASIAQAADYSIFRVCQDQRVIHTSDGAEAGHVEYIVVDPSNRQVISTVVSGGVVGERLVSIPYTSMRFDNDREITLTEINRERLVSAPVIERTEISTSVIHPEVIQRTTQHFTVRAEQRVNERDPQTNIRTGDDRAREEAAARAPRAGDRPNAAAGARGNRPPDARGENRGDNNNNERSQAAAPRERRANADDRNDNGNDAAARARESAPPSDQPRRNNNNASESEAAKTTREADPQRKEQPSAPRSESRENARPESAEPRRGTSDSNRGPGDSEKEKAAKPSEERSAESEKPRNQKSNSTRAGDENRKEETRSPQP